MDRHLSSCRIVIRDRYLCIFRHCPANLGFVRVLIRYPICLCRQRVDCNSCTFRFQLRDPFRPVCVFKVTHPIFKARYLGLRRISISSANRFRWSPLNYFIRILVRVSRASKGFRIAVGFSIFLSCPVGRRGLRLFSIGASRCAIR